MAAALPVVEGYAPILERIAAHAELTGTLDAIVALLEHELPGAVGSLMRASRDGRSLHPLSVRGLPPAFVARLDGLPVRDGMGPCGTAAALRAPVFAADLASDPRWASVLDHAAAHGLAACWSTPILSRRHAVGELLGTFAVYFRAPRAPTDADRDALARAEHLACVAIEVDSAVRDLGESDARLRLFVDHATDGFYVVSATTLTVVEANQQACTSLGYTRDELIGLPTTAFDRSPRADILRRLTAGDTVTVESRHVRKDGTDFPVEIRARPFESRGERYHLAVVRDVTARRELEDQLRQAQKMEAIGRLAGGIAHDFNNLLTVINGYADVLLATLPHEAAQHADLTMIREAGERAAAVTAQLLAFSRRSIVAPQPVDLNALVERLARMCRHLIGETIALTTQLAPDLGLVTADPGQLEQVVVNLVVNARDAMPRGGSLSITTSATMTAAGARAILRVTDTGDGMTEEVRARAFEPFFTTKPPGQGTGLGLATVYGIVQQAGGEIRLESAPGRGTAVTIALPARESAHAPAPAPPTARPRGTETVLLAEDEDGVRWLVQRALELHGYRVLLARTDEEAEAAAPAA